jgi:tetratricopeptide (TPR) repeat protein
MKLACLAVALALVSPLRAQSRGGLPPDAIYAQSKGSVVTILTFDANKAPQAQGSGFVIAKNRVATNYHVLAGSTSAAIIFSDGSMALVKSVIAASLPEDIAVVETDTGNRIPLPLGNELQLKVGETVYAIGTPNGLIASLSSGLVSAFRQDEGQFLIQITAQIAPGSSGGPLFNSQGQVVGVTTSRLKDGGFGFAVGASDLEHVLKVPLPITVTLSDLPSEEANSASGDELKPVQDLLDSKKYTEALNSFQKLSAPTKSGFDGQLLLCRIQEEIPDYELAIRACDAAIALRPDAPEPRGAKALTLLASGDPVSAEASALKATELSNDGYYARLLGVVYYEEEKYALVPNQFTADSKDPFVLSLLAGAALHNRDFQKFQQISGDLTQIKGENNPWQLYRDGVSAELNLDFDTAREKFRKCDEDEDFIDAICVLSLAIVETRQGSYESAKSHVDQAVSRFPRDHSALSEAIFIDLLAGDASEAKRLHDSLVSLSYDPVDEGTDCLYFYGMGQPKLATDHCTKLTQTDEKNYVAWSNAGYVAVDNGDYQSALSYFVKAEKIFGASTEKHTVAEDVDLTWGMILAAYFDGDRKDAKAIYRGLKKEYPTFSTLASLKQLPLIWSDTTQALIEKVIADLK